MLRIRFILRKGYLMNKKIRKISLLLYTLALVNILALGSVFASYEVPNYTKIVATVDGSAPAPDYLGRFDFELRDSEGNLIGYDKSIDSIVPEPFVNRYGDGSNIELQLYNIFKIYIQFKVPEQGPGYRDFTLKQIPTGIADMKYDPKIYNIRLHYRAIINPDGSFYKNEIDYYEVEGKTYDAFGSLFTLDENGTRVFPLGAHLNFLFNNKTVHYTSHTVNKVWKNGSETSIQAQLYQDGLAYGAPVELNAANGWTYTWTNLDDSYNWTVKEFSVPAGYKLDIETNADGSVTTLTNTKLASPSIPPANTVKASPVNTGDSSDAAAWFMMFSTSLLCICFVLSIKLRKQER